MCGTCGCGSENNGPTILKPGEHKHVHDEHHHIMLGILIHKRNIITMIILMRTRTIILMIISIKY